MLPLDLRMTGELGLRAGVPGAERDVVVAAGKGMALLRWCWSAEERVGKGIAGAVEASDLSLLLGLEADTGVGGVVRVAKAVSTRRCCCFAAPDSGAISDDPFSLLDG